MYHRKNKHSNSIAMCRNKLKDQCNFPDDVCWWSHEKKPDVSIACYFCNANFETKGALMIHRKSKHSNFVRMCTQYVNGNCKYEEGSCWFQHSDNKKKISKAHPEEKNETNDEKESEQVFLKVSDNLEPPIEKKERMNQN